MNWYIFSDDVFLSSALTDMPETNIRSHDQSTATAIMTCSNLASSGNETDDETHYEVQYPSQVVR